MPALISWWGASPSSVWPISAFRRPSRLHERAVGDLIAVHAQKYAVFPFVIAFDVSPRRRDDARRFVHRPHRREERRVTSRGDRAEHGRAEEHRFRLFGENDATARRL